MARNVGKHTHRFKSNPRERIAAELWQQECGNPPIGGPDMLNYMLGNGKDPVEVSDRDREVAATVIQWLGSPVGNNFLRELLERFNKASTYAYDGTDCGCPEAIEGVGRWQLLHYRTPRGSKVKILDCGGEAG